MMSMGVTHLGANQYGLGPLIKLPRKLRQAPSITVPNLEYVLHVTPRWV